MRKINKIIVFIMASMFIMSCDDVFEDDISDDTVELLSPGDGRVVEADAITFSWGLIEDADEYQFQLRDEVINLIVVDSILPSNSLNIEVEPSEYSWRVKAQNFGYETDFTFPRDLTVLLANDLSDTNVVLVSPALDTYFSSEPITLAWEAVESADSYSVLVTTVQSGVDVEVLSEVELTENIFSLDASILENEGEYSWSVKAINDVSESEYAFSRFLIDNTLPDIPVVTAPENDITVLPAQIINFIWELPVDQGLFQSPIASFIEISDTSSFENLILNETLEGQVFTYEIPTDNVELWWRIRFIDEAGNQSEYSEIRRVIVE